MVDDTGRAFFLLGGDWNFPETVGNVIIPTDFRIFFRGVGLNHQPLCAFKRGTFYSSHVLSNYWGRTCNIHIKHARHYLFCAGYLQIGIGIGLLKTPWCDWCAGFFRKMVDLRIEVVAVFHIDEHSGISHKKWISTLQDCETTVIINISKHAGIGESLFFSFPQVWTTQRRLCSRWSPGCVTWMVGLNCGRNPHFWGFLSHGGNPQLSSSYYPLVN